MKCILSSFKCHIKTQRKHKVLNEIKCNFAGSLNSSSGDLASSPAALSTGHKVFREFVNTFRLKLRLYSWNLSTLKWNPFINILDPWRKSQIIQYVDGTYFLTFYQISIFNAVREYFRNWEHF